MQRSARAVSLLELAEKPLSAKKFPANFLVAPLEQFEGKELGYAAHAAHRMGVTHGNFWRRLAARSEILAEQMPPKYLAQVIFSLAQKSQTRNFENLVKNFAAKFRVARPAEVALVLKALAARDASLAPEMRKIVGNLARPEIAAAMGRRGALISLVSIAKMKMIDSTFIDAASDFLESEISNLTPEEISGWFRALATTGRNIPDTKISDCMRNCRPEIACDVLFSLAVANAKNPEIAEALIGNISDNLAAIDVSALCFALANIQKISDNPRKIFLRGLQRVSRELGNAEISALAAIIGASEKFGNDADTAILRRFILEHLPKFPVHVAPDLLCSSLKSQAEKILRDQTRTLKEEEALEILKRTRDVDRLLADEISEQINFSTASQLALGKLPTQAPTLADACRAALMSRNTEILRRANELELSAKDAEIVVATALRLVKTDDRDVGLALALRFLEDSSISVHALSGLVRVANEVKNSKQLNDRVLALVHGNLDKPLPCKLLCRALQISYGPSAGRQSHEQLERLVQAAVACAVQLTAMEFCAFLKILSNLGVKSETVQSLAPLTTVRHSQSGPLEKHKIEKLARTLEMDFGEIEWTQELIEHEDQATKEKARFEKLKSKTKNRK